jgi:hypothetical protein
VDFGTDDFNEGFLDRNVMELAMTKKPEAPAPDYHEWLAIGRKLCKAYNDLNWKIGDWLVLGRDYFDWNDLLSGLPGHMTLHKTVSGDGGRAFAATKIPNFWKDAAEATGMAVSTLKQQAKVAYAYPDKKKRVKGLTFTHHLFAAMAYQFEKRYEYLEACKQGLSEGERPRGVEWLKHYIAVQEGRNAELLEDDRLYPVRFFVPEELQRKLKQLGKFYKMQIGDLVKKVCTEAVNGYLAVEAEKVALKKYGVYEGKWPFYDYTDEPASVKKLRQRPRAGLSTGKRSHHRVGVQQKTHEDMRQHGRTVAINRWKRNEKVA